MMKSPEYLAIAVRRESGEIGIYVEDSPPPARKHKFLGWPLIRGVVNFCQSMSMSMKTINKAADMLGIADEEPSRFERWLRKRLGDKAEKAFIGISMFLAAVLAIALFVALPSLAAMLIKSVIDNTLLINLAEGIVRIGIFLGYILAISKMKEIHRVFSYHGAEHKTVHCYEHDEELTVENVQKFSTLHPRCGTAFLFIVMAVSILFFSIFGWNYNALTRIVSRLLMLPLVAGFSYEVLRWFALKENILTRILRAPGMWLQKLTTRQPDDSMVEVAIAAFKAAQTGTEDGVGQAVEATDEGRVLL